MHALTPLPATTRPPPPARSLPSDMHLEEGDEAPPGCPPLPRRPQFPPADVLAALQPALPPGMSQEQGGALLSSWAFLHAFGPMLGLREVTVSMAAAAPVQRWLPCTVPAHRRSLRHMRGGDATYGRACAWEPAPRFRERHPLPFALSCAQLARLAIVRITPSICRPMSCWPP